jgi:hypothetical protein
MFTHASHSANAVLDVQTSADGIHWSYWGRLGTTPAYSNNIGVEGTPEGFIDTNAASLLVSFGAPYGLSTTDQWGRWNLYVAEVALSRIAPPPPTPTVSPGNGTVAMRRLYAPSIGDHLFTTNPGENPPGFVYEGSPFNVWTASASGRVAIYRCYVGSKRDHFISTNAGCEGQAVEGLYGYLSAGGTVAIYRCFNGYFHLATTDTGECQRAGFKVEGVLGYAP